MSVFGNDIIQQSNPLESIVTNMKINVEDQLRIWNMDFWYNGVSHNSEYMKSTLEKQFCAYFEKDFDKIGLNVWKIVVYVWRKKHGFTGEDIHVIVEYWDEVSSNNCLISNRFDLFSIDFDFQYNNPGMV